MKNIFLILAVLICATPLLAQIDTEVPTEQNEEAKPAQALAEKKAKEKADKARAEKAARDRAAKAAAMKQQKAKQKRDNGYQGFQEAGKSQGMQGDPGGEPAVSKKESIETATSSGFGKRKYTIPKIAQEKFNEEGKVVIKVCVNPAGKVISADYTFKGSTTNNPALIKLAKENAFKYKFDPIDLDENQCGTITYKFNLIDSDK